MTVDVSKFHGDAIKINLELIPMFTPEGEGKQKKDSIVVYMKKGTIMENTLNLINCCNSYYESLSDVQKKYIPSLEDSTIQDYILKVTKNLLSYSAPIIKYLVNECIINWEGVLSDGKKIDYNPDICESLLNQNLESVSHLLVSLMLLREGDTFVNLENLEKK